MVCWKHGRIIFFKNFKPKFDASKQQMIFTALSLESALALKGSLALKGEYE